METNSYFITKVLGYFFFCTDIDWTFLDVDNKRMDRDWDPVIRVCSVFAGNDVQFLKLKILAVYILPFKC